MAVPQPQWFGHQLNTMNAWLEQHADEDCYYIGTEAGPGLQDAALFYFLDANMGAAFIDRLACGLIVGRQSP